MELLKEHCGMDIGLDLAAKKLVFGEGVRKVKPELRTGEQVRELLNNPGGKLPAWVYAMYREVCNESDCGKIANADLRFDLTLFPSLSVNGEYNKTYGHFHPKVKGSELTYPEVYEVVYGEGHFLLQNDENVLLFEGGQGDKILIPPNYGHVTINPGKGMLLIANWIERNFRSDYGDYKGKKGAMYFETKEGWKKNPNYKNVPEIKKIRVKDVPDFGLFRGNPMYETGIEDLGRLDFLKSPGKYLEVFDDYLK